MAFNGTNNVLIKEVPLVLKASWQLPYAILTTPDWEMEHTATVDGETKPTLLVGSRRRQKTETFSKLIMHAELVQEGLVAGVVSNVAVEAIEGFEIVFELTNKYYQTPAKTPLRYTAKLNQLGAAIELSETEVRDVIFKRNGQLNAKVNENLLDFTVTIPALSIGTESLNRVTVYRRKFIVFVPGLLGSTIAVKTSEGPVQIYPSVYPTVSEKQKTQLDRFYDVLTIITPTGLVVKEGLAAGKYLGDYWNHRHLDLLECDAAGKPLLETKAELFRLLGALPGVWINQYLSAAVVYDVQDMLANQWTQRGTYTNRPDNFDPFVMIPYPYDWRLDLEDSAQALFADLQQLQKSIQGADDTDDLFSIAGHSTGGVINRRVCGLSGVDAVVEHAFFMNVPFRGAPKALSVLLFGGDPPAQGKYNAMMPAALIDAESMVHIAANLPIVYFLAPSNFYPDPVATLGGNLYARLFPFLQTPLATRDLEKEYLVKGAVMTGIFQAGRSVDPSTGGGDRAKLALGAGEWNHAWWDISRRNAYGVFWDQDALARYNQQEIRDTENLRYEYDNRQTQTSSWNKTIADNATRFHSISEAKIGTTGVALFVFWSERNRTTGSVNINPDGEPQALGVLDMGVSTNDYFNDGKYPTYDIGSGFDFRFQWWIGRMRQYLKFTSQDVDGDGTVPRASLLGIGTTNAKIFRPIPGNPPHVPAPNAPYVWELVLKVLTGRSVDSDVVQEPAVNKPFP